MKCAAIIPARFGSTRFPGKPLALIKDKPMIQWVYENTAACGLVGKTVVATDSEEIRSAVCGFGGEAVMTSPDHETGTDRIAEAAENIDAELIINVQGDEPVLPAAAIEKAVLPLVNDSTIPMGTLKTKILKNDELSDTNIVKVITDINDFALYFSRSVVPFDRDGNNEVDFYRHIGLYVYRKDFLFKVSKMEQTLLEKAEKLEQLRVLENGYSIIVKETDYYPVGVDVPDDILKVEKLMNGGN
jgi:3-deoxy-manno-octulosonate cytidylyltransferase (CMP-KDO synthetase)